MSDKDQLETIEGKIILENGVISIVGKNSLEQTVLSEYFDDMRRKGFREGQIDAIKSIVKNLSVTINEII